MTSNLSTKLSTAISTGTLAQRTCGDGCEVRSRPVPTKPTQANAKLSLPSSGSHWRTTDRIHPSSAPLVVDTCSPSCRYRHWQVPEEPDEQLPSRYHRPLVTSSAAAGRGAGVQGLG